jgi:hypothetical protein
MTADENPYRPPDVALEPQGPEIPPYRPGGPVAASTVVLLCLTIPAETASAVLALLWPETPLFEEPPRLLLLVLVLSAVVSLVSAAIQIACAVLFCVWFYRVYCNLLALGEPRLRFAPGWAPGGFFVPILNLFRPYQIAGEIWQRSEGAVQGGGPVPLWWALFLGANVVSLVGGRLERFHPLSRVLSVLGALLSIFAALVTIRMIRGVGRRQDGRFARMVEERR